MRIWDLATGDLVRSLPAGLNVAARAAARASREEEEEEADEGEDGVSPMTRTMIPAAPDDNDGFGQLEPVRDVSWHPSGTTLAAASFDGTITVFGARGCRKRGSGGGGGRGGVGFGPGNARRAAMLPVRDDDDDDDDEDYEPE